MGIGDSLVSKAFLMQNNQQPILSEWLLEVMKEDKEFRDFIMKDATELDKEVYDLHQFEKKE